MMPSDDLRDIWVSEDGKMVVRGDAAAIDEMLGTKLEKVRSDASGWLVVYRHRETNQFWELSYPQSEMHGGGPRRLRLIGDAS
jgi:Immunity protein 27